MNQEHVELGLEAWKTAIQVQQHFNDLELRVRQFALTILAAVLTASAAVVGAATLRIGELETNLSALILLAGALVWTAFYFVDRVWYHPLLVGAVNHTIKLEEELSESVPGVGLTKSIGASSPVQFFCLTLRSKNKMSVFYLGVLGVLLGLVVAAHLGG